MNSVRVFALKLWNYDLPRLKKRFFSYRGVRKFFSGRNASSISDNYFFPQFCKKVAKSDKFWNFRQSTLFQEILEHTSYEQGINYIQNILNMGFDYNFIRKCIRDDFVGNPNQFNYKNLGLTCPSNLRYANVLADLISKFSNLNHFSIVEIGGGYGGQARLIRKFFPSVNYTIIDLPEVLLLTERYLYESDYSHMYKFVSAFDLKSIECDLLISNYAFSELSRKNQFEYLNKIILKSRRGYMIYTTVSPPDLNSLSLTEVLREIPKSAAFPESPSTGPGNTLIYWN